jgi:PAS domain S-box-containing protein
MSELQFRALVENSSDAIFLSDDQGQITYCSPSLGRVLGYSAEELIDKSGFLLVHPDELSYAHKVFHAALENPNRHVSFVIRARHKDESWRNLEVVCQNRLDDPLVRAVVVSFRDVTDRQRAEDALRESEERYRSLVEMAQDAILILQDELICYCNPSAARLIAAPTTEA